MTKETTTSNRRRASRAAMRGSNKFRNSFCSEISAYSSTPDTTCFVAPFERSELSFGIKLGSGSFSDVYEITSFHLTGAGCGFSEEEIKKREAMARETLDPNGARYVLKQIKLGMERSESHEAEMLSALDHRSIVKIHGKCARGHDAFLDGCSEYVMILESS